MTISPIGSVLSSPYVTNVPDRPIQRVTNDLPIEKTDGSFVTPVSSEASAAINKLIATSAIEETQAIQPKELSRAFEKIGKYLQEQKSPYPSDQEFEFDSVDTENTFKENEVFQSTAIQQNQNQPASTDFNKIVSLLTKLQESDGGQKDSGSKLFAAQLAQVRNGASYNSAGSYTPGRASSLLNITA